MIEIKRFIFNSANANCYVVSDETKECVVIDPCACDAYERNLLIDYIEKESLKPRHALLTHGHYDHVLCCDLMCDKYGLMPEVHQRDQLWMNRVQGRIEEVYGKDYFKSNVPMPEQYLQDDEYIGFGSHKLKVIHTPGHSPGSVVYYCEEEKIVFTGDTLFRNSIGKADLLFGYIVDLTKSLQHLTEVLPDEVIIYPGHDESTTMGYEKAHNRFFKYYKIGNNMKHLVVLSGAGISAESGLATFRDKNGLWTKVDAKELASLQGYRINREKVLEFYNTRRHNLLTVEPNHAHKVLAELEKDYCVSIITQNVDDLHERAGSTNVLHLHGELKKVTGSANPNDPTCIAEKPLDEPIKIGDKAADGSQLRPYIVFFGESVPNMVEAKRICKEADIFVIIGTSLQVYPAASLIESVPWGIPNYIIDPGEFYADNGFYDFEHIQMGAVAGIDILKQKLNKL